MKKLLGKSQIIKSPTDFNSAKPFRHICIDNFLEEQFAYEIEKSFPTPKDKNYHTFCLQDDGKIGENYANPDPTSWGAVFRSLDSLMSSEEFINYLQSLTGIDGLIYDPTYQGGGIRISKDQTFLPVHLDFNRHPQDQKLHRRLNVLIYMNIDWNDDWGGHIQVHDNPNEKGTAKSLVAEYSPKFNRAFIFETSENSWHGFKKLNLPIHRERRLFSVYFYTLTRPEGDVPFRNTEYVEPWIPEHISLTEEDRIVMENLLRRRDDRIAMLYKIRREFDAKYAHLWSEYEYYLKKYKELEADATR